MNRRSLQERARRALRQANFRVQQDTPGSAGQYFAEEPDAIHYRLPLPASYPSGAVTDAATLPVPPRSLWLGYGSSEADYLDSGRGNVVEMLKVVRADGFDFGDAPRILDWGCAAGRMTRWLSTLVPGAEVWGVDISAAAIRWAAEHLSPPGRFATVTTLPHLPFEDNSFDLIVGGSVFTHIDTLDDMWLLELRRILRPGGRIWVTVLDKHSLAAVQETARTGGNLDWLGRQVDQSGLVAHDTNFAKLVVNRSLRAMTVLVDIDYLRHTWSRFLDVVAVEPDAGYGHQTMVVLAKP